MLICLASKGFTDSGTALHTKLFTRKMDHLQAKLATKKSGIMKFMTRVKPKEAVPIRKEVRS